MQKDSWGNSESEGYIEYREKLGYISVGNFDRDEEIVFCYEKIIESATGF